MLTIFLLTLLAQQPQDPVRSAELATRMVATTNSTEAYNKDCGLVWPKKETDRLAVAMQALHECEAWKNYAPPID